MDKLLFFSIKSTQQTVPSLTEKDTDYTFTSDIRHHRRKKTHLEYYIITAKAISTTDHTYNSLNQTYRQQITSVCRTQTKTPIFTPQ